jgi:phosphatidylserine decarboxylase
VNDAFIVTMLSVVPKGLGSRLQGAVGRLGLSRHLIRWYAGHYGVNTDEMVGTLEDYGSLQDFFVRELKPGARPVDGDADALVAPSDSKAVSFGDIVDGKLPADAPMKLDITMLVGGDTRFADGHYAVLYLSPKDYHRVHHAVDGRVAGYAYRPGQFWPVFPAAVEKIDNLFAVNERLTLFVDTQAHGRVAQVLVAAYGVGRMSCAHAPIITNTGGALEDQHLDEPVKRGDEAGRFNLGSTVILVMEKGTVEWELERGQDVLVGQRIGRLITRGSASTPES